MEEYQGSQQIIIQSHLGKATSVDSLRMVRHKLEEFIDILLNSLIKHSTYKHNRDHYEYFHYQISIRLGRGYYEEGDEKVHSNNHENEA